MERPKLEGVSFPSISMEDRKWLERDFEEEEVERALLECKTDKAPAPNGFNFCFIKAGMNFLKELIDMFTESHQRGKLNKAINGTFLTLIPKASNPMEHRGYRCISLVG